MVSGSPVSSSASSTASNPRLVALRCLREVDRGTSFSNRVLGRRLEQAADLSASDRGLATALMYGVLRHRGRLDHHLDAACKGRRVRGELREILRLGAFELLELGHPAYAAISEAMRLSQGLSGGHGVRTLVHAVLSRVAEEGPALERTWENGKPLDALEKRWSIPRWWAGRWIRQLGPERALARARALAETPPVEVRVDLDRTTREEVVRRLQAEQPSLRLELSSLVPSGIRVHGGGDLFHLPVHEEGLVSVQSLASQRPARLLDPRPGHRVLDACAGLGVKTIQLAELMGRQGTIVAVDRDERKLDDLRMALHRARIPPSLQVEVLAADLGEERIDGLDDSAGFDRILLDAPCTGLGNVARHPEIRWRRRFEDITALATIQQRLLRRCMSVLAPGARLVYAVCSLEPEEGPEVIAAVLGDHTGFSVEHHTWTPEDHGTEGFFAAVIVPRTGSHGHLAIPPGDRPPPQAP